MFRLTKYINMCKYNTALFALIFLILINVSSSCSNGGCERRPNGRILGGVASDRNSRPFQVALYLRVGAQGDIGFCGGSLVHQQWVLTAAHCCYHGNEAVTHGQAILGVHSLYDRYENGRRMINVEEFVVRPDWDPETFVNDLALLKLANTIQTSDTIGIVRLPYLSTVTSNFAGVGATVSGWGIASDDVTFISPILREKMMTVMVDSLCNSFYYNNLPPNIICGLSSASGTCKGDNGGPMTIFSSSTNETILVGVASFVAAEGCNSDLPSVFTRTQRYLDWISNNTGIVLD